MLLQPSGQLWSGSDRRGTPRTRCFMHVPNLYSLEGVSHCDGATGGNAACDEGTAMRSAQSSVKNVKSAKCWSLGRTLSSSTSRQDRLVSSGRVLILQKTGWMSINQDATRGPGAEW